MRYLVEHGLADQDTVIEYYVIDQADDVEHAIEQVLDAHPDHKIFAVHRLLQVW